ncbi:SRPBCC domain-containing protein [Novosphingobium album (ex Liu et al. 2023)]|uniref:SRPBCC domain-containing protein n=1 Tax=Novosphingobium album (ex Liu et al. 2023) TaxID=3031130 RepID=A0ABT5WSJ4_9SPHN|nr:SRPBCC domain-containing protein [Novosphingobium album (ex Liu et al. 2023)]MDE8651973.1 SRPBCC domain-containing protein [Novosphingobium album (ex Liu et al. 2023)]
MSDETPNQLSVTRYIAAPPAKVWDVMAHRQEEWWCPVPWRVEIDEQDRRPGGACRMTMYGPNGEVAPQDGIFLAYDEGRRFVTTDAIVGDFQPAGPFMIGIWEIAPEGEGTRYTASARHWREENRKTHEQMGFVDGWAACAAQLAAICENERA